MKNNKKLHYSREDVWERINRIIKKKYKGKQKDFAKALGFSSARICNPKGRKTLPISLVIAIKEKLNIPSDFILFGDTTQPYIPPELLED